MTEDEERYARLRQRMVESQLQDRGIRDPAVLDAFLRVPRHRFVPREERYEAYEDHPLPIGSGQTISQPYVVAYMLQKLELEGNERVLEIGTGSGYQTALLAEIADQVYTVECLPELALRARQILEELGYDNVQARIGDGAAGWPEAAPFDAIIGSAAPQELPPLLVDQLSPGGRMILPVGTFNQSLILVEKKPDGFVRRTPLLPVRFVPMQSGPA